MASRHGTLHTFILVCLGVRDSTCDNSRQATRVMEQSRGHVRDTTATVEGHQWDSETTGQPNRERGTHVSPRRAHSRPRKYSACTFFGSSFKNSEYARFAAWMLPDSARALAKKNLATRSAVDHVSQAALAPHTKTQHNTGSQYLGPCGQPW